MERKEFMKTKYEEYKNEFEKIKTDLSVLIKKLELKYSVEFILTFDSIAIKDIQIKNSNKEGQKQYYFSMLSSESYLVDGKPLRKRTVIYEKNINKAKNIGLEKFYDDFIDYYKLYALFNRNKFLLLDLEMFISINFFENEAIKRINYFYEDIEKLGLMNNNEEYTNLVDLLNFEKEYIKTNKEKYSEKFKKLK